jgi:hypothetical protein
MPTRAGVVCVPPAGVGPTPFIGLQETERVPARTRLAPQDLLGHFEDIHVPFGLSRQSFQTPNHLGVIGGHGRLGRLDDREAGRVIEDGIRPAFHVLRSAPYPRACNCENSPATPQYLSRPAWTQRSVSSRLVNEARSMTVRLSEQRFDVRHRVIPTLRDA